MSRGAYYAEGRYWGRITEQALGASTKGNPQFVLTFLVLGKVDPEDPEGALLPCEKYQRSIYRVINENTIDFVVEDLSKLGFVGESFKQLDPSVEGFHDFRGEELAFYCSHDTYEGTVREKWSFAREGGGLQVKPLEPKQVRELDSLFGKHLKKSAKPKPTAKANANPDDANAAFQNAVAEAGNDDIPF